jgi:DNA-binding MarR family transcriptional regulator
MFKSESGSMMDRKVDFQHPHRSLEPLGFTEIGIARITHLIRRLVKAEELYTKELARKYQITTSQLLCLLALDEKGPMSGAQIARFIMVSPSTVVGIVDRLEQKGLVRRSRNNGDRRLVIVDLTSAGRAFSQNAPPPIQRKLLKIIKEHPESEVEKIAEGLNMLVRILDK